MKTKDTCISKIVLIIIGFAVLASYSGQWEVFTNKNDVRDIALSGKTLWAATTGGVVAWNLFGSAVVSPNLPYKPNSSSHIIQDKYGTVWFGTSGSGLLAYKEDRWYQFTQRDGIPNNSIRSLALDSKSNLWILTNNGIAMRKFGGMVHNQARNDFVNPGKKPEIKRRGSRFYVSLKDKPDMIRCTLYDLRGRVVLRQTIHGRKSFVLPESNIDFGSGLRILSIIIENSGGSQNKYLIKMGDVK